MADGVTQEFSWQAHPARERVGGALGGVGVIMAVGGVVYFSFGAGWSILSVIVLVGALNRFFFPSRFTIDPEGITARYPLRTQRFRWGDLRRWAVDRHGCYLSTRARRSRLDAYRGMHVLFGRYREAVLDRIRDHLAKGDVAWDR